MSNELPKEFEYLVLFAALCGRTFNKSELGLDVKIKDLDRLVAETKLLNSVKKGAGRELSANTHTLAWAAANLNLEMPGKAQAVLAIVHLIRAKTHAYLKAHKLSLAEFMEPVSSAEAEVEAPSLSSDDAVAAVKRAYLGLASSSYGSRVPLKDLRRQLRIDRAAQDAAFLELIHSGDANFYSEDNPAQRNDEDEQAALILADRRRHIMYLHK